MIMLRYHLVFAFFRPLFRWYAELAYNCRVLPGPELPLGQPALILANHNGNLDPCVLAGSFRRPIFFVASDHIFRLGLASSIIRYLVAPIPIVKSRIDLQTIRSIHRVLNDGGIVGLFPEGNRSFNGLTGMIPPSTGKLVQKMKVTLLLYRFSGGYLTSPRWARHHRCGQMRCEVVRRLNPDELAGMTPDAINQVIQEALLVDSFADQRVNPVRYKGKKPAEYLERALFLCPKCNSLASLHSCNDRFFCSCGLNVRFNPLGFFEPVDPWSADRLSEGSFLETVASWDAWQCQALDSMLGQTDHFGLAGQRPIFSDDGEILFNCERAARSTRLDEGRLEMFRDRLEFTGSHISQQIIPLDQIDRIIVHGAQVLQFATKQGQILEVRSKIPRSAYKYVVLHHLLQKQKGGALMA